MSSVLYLLQGQLFTVDQKTRRKQNLKDVLSDHNSGITSHPLIFSKIFFVFLFKVLDLVL